MRHVGQRHLALMRVAQDVDADTVADEDDVHAGLRHGQSGWRVIGGHRDDLLAAPLHVEKMRGCEHSSA